MYVKIENTEITKTESMNEKAPEETERGSVLRMSSPWKKVARKPTGRAAVR
jgi:hypothetical protein